MIFYLSTPTSAAFFGFVLILTFHLVVRQSADAMAFIPNPWKP